MKPCLKAVFGRVYTTIRGNKFQRPGIGTETASMKPAISLASRKNFRKLPLSLGSFPRYSNKETATSIHFASLASAYVSLFSPTDKSRSDPCNRRSSSKWKYWKRKKITRESLSNDGTNVVPDGRWTCHNLLSWIRNCYVRMRGSASCCRVGCILPVASIMPFTGKSTRWNKDSHDATSTVNALFLSRCWDHLFSSNCCVMAIGL